MTMKRLCVSDWTVNHIRVPYNMTDCHVRRRRVSVCSRVFVVLSISYICMICYEIWVRLMQHSVSLGIVYADFVRYFESSCFFIVCRLHDELEQVEKSLSTT